MTSLRQRRDRPYFGEAEPQTQYRIDNFPILIKTRREPKRVRKIETESADREARVVWRGRQPGKCLQNFKRPNGPFMRILGIEPEQNRTRQRIQKADHPKRPAKSCPPSGRSGRGFAQTTASSGRAE